MAKNTIQYVPDPNKFDLVTHRWDAQGLLVAKNPYRSFTLEGKTLFERPTDSGNLWGENNQPMGRVTYTRREDGAIIAKKFDYEAEHIEYVAPPTGAEAVAAELAAANAKNAALEAELASIRGDSAAKAAPAAAKPAPENFALKATAKPEAKA